MPYSDTKKAVFLHIPKTGGTTVMRAFNIQLLHDSNPAVVPTPQHYTCAMLRERIGDEKYDSYYKFAIVRNPWARIVSSYFWRQTLPKKRLVLPFNEFVSNLHQIVPERQFYTQDFGDHFIPQSEYTLDVDEVFMFEDFNNTIRSIAKRLAQPEPVLQANKKGQYGDYTQYYDRQSRDTIASIYADEIEEFGFKFGE